MRGYFARVASRLSGSPIKSSLKPQRANFWPSTQNHGQDEMHSSNAAPASQWPDAFNGNPLSEASVRQPSKKEKDYNSPQIQPATRIENITPQSQSFSGTKHSISESPSLTPPSKEKQSFSTDSPIKETISTSESIGNSSILPPKTPTQKGHVQNESLPPQKVNPPTRIPFSRQLRETKMEEGLLTEMPIQPISQTQVSTQKVLQETKLERIIEKEIQAKKEIESRVALVPESPKQQRFVSKENGTLLPQAPRNSRGNTLAPQAPPPKQELVIGKLTVEIVEPKQPSIVVAPAQQQHHSPAPRKQVSRSGNNLKYGLGQI